MSTASHLPQRDDYPYQPCYCEENIWQLCQQPGLDNGHVIIIAALGESFPIFWQREAETLDQPVFWDYHVVLLWRAAPGEHYILDFDTRLPFCTPVQAYFEASFVDESLLEPDLRPLFRLMPTQEYVTSLQSDRRHMRTENGWLATPPKWPPISPSNSNLKLFTDMTTRQFGHVQTATELLRGLAAPNTDPEGA